MAAMAKMLMVTGMVQAGPVIPDLHCVLCHMSDVRTLRAQPTAQAACRHTSYNATRGTNNQMFSLCL